MTERKNIWDILSNKELDIQQEYENLWALIENGNTVSKNGYYSYSVLDILRENFIDFESRNTFITIDSFLDYLELNRVRYGIQTIDKLDLFIEIIILMFQELKALNFSNVFRYKYNYSDIRHSIMKNIDLILEKSNQRIVEIEPNKKIVVPNDEVVTVVSDIILPDNERLALSILSYSHYRNKDNIEGKANILTNLHKYLEQKQGKIKDKNIEYVFNNFMLRHGLKKNKQRVDMLGTKKVNALYDALFEEILYFMLEKEHADFNLQINEIKKEVGDAGK
ncbi:hypothetical protein OfM1_20670 [Lactovum odontotermitis]